MCSKLDLTASKRPHPFERDIQHLYKQFMASAESASDVDHSGLKGARIEKALAKLLKRVMPKKYTVKTNQIIVDITGQESRECDIVIIDATQHFDLFSNYIPIEIVYGVIEVKKNLDHKAAKDFREKVINFRKLNYRGYYSNGEESRLKKRSFHFCPPSYNLFSLTTGFKEFENFIARTYVEPFGNVGYKNNQDYSKSLTHFLCISASLDMGATRNDCVPSRSFFALDNGAESGSTKTVDGVNRTPSGEKALYMFLYELEYVLSTKEIVPGFDNRAYLNYCEQFGYILEPNADKVWGIINKMDDRK